MTDNEKINGWTFEETVKTAENLMEYEQNMFKWDVLRHLRDFVEKYKEELQQYRVLGTVEELRIAKEKRIAKKPNFNGSNWYRCVHGCEVHKKQFERDFYCSRCGQAILWESDTD